MISLDKSRRQMTTDDKTLFLNVLNIFIHFQNHSDFGFSKKSYPNIKVVSLILPTQTASFAFRPITKEDVWAVCCWRRRDGCVGVPAVYHVTAQLQSRPRHVSKYTRDPPTTRPPPPLFPPHTFFFFSSHLTLGRVWQFLYKAGFPSIVVAEKLTLSTKPYPNTCS